MDAIECIKSRRSIRRYTEELVDHETIEKIIDLARFAPSWKNSQTARYIIVEDKEKINKIAAEACLNFEGNMKTLEKANQLLVLCSKKNRSGYERDGSFTTSKGSSWEMFDAGIAAQTFSLAANVYGVGSVMMGIFDEDKVKKILEIPEDLNVSCLLSFGYPKFIPDPVPRKEVSDLLFFQ